MKKIKKCKKYGLIFTARSRLQKKSVFINTDFFCKLKEPCLAARLFRLSKNLYRYQKWVFSVACSAGFASCKTFGKQPKHPCFGRSPKVGRRDASPRIHPRHGCRACMHKGFARCKANQAYTAFHGEKGFSARMPK